MIAIDGELVSEEAAVISVRDRGLLFGDGCFEVLRTWGGVAVELPAHLDRLYETAAYLKLRARERELVAGDVVRAVHAAGPGEHRIRIVLTRGPGGLAAPLATLGPGRAIVIVEPLPAPPRELTLAVVDFPLPARAVRGHKTLAYLDHVLALELAHAAGADEALRLDADGAVVEGATCNVFVVDEAGTIATPATDRGALPGVVRGRVIAACEREGYPVRIRPIAVEELRAASEVFVTSSLRGVVPVTRIDDHVIPHGPIAARIAATYSAALRGG